MTYPDFRFESKLWGMGLDHIAGVDEVGRGSFAGPVVAAAVIFPSNITPEHLIGINDSKLLTAKKREYLVPIIHQHALYYSVSECSVSTINRVGILKATFKAMRQSLKDLPSCQHVLVDGHPIPNLKNLNNNQTPIIKGDRVSLSIAAASILAKVYRDDLMKILHIKTPHFHWDQNKGYGTKKHQLALQKHGPTRHHRKMFINSTLST